MRTGSVRAVLLAGLLLAACMSAHAAITDQQKRQIVEVFNQARRTTLVPAADMKIVRWDEELGARMQEYTDACVNQYEDFKNPRAFFLYRDQALDPVGVAKWRTLRMAPHFDLYTGKCMNTPKAKEICRHPENYEKVMYAENERIGCGMTRCGPGNKGVFHACAVRADVAPHGDIRYAWTPGERCSKCPPGWEYCIDGLCSDEPPTEKPSKAPTFKPTKSPTRPKPTKSPTRAPTRKPTKPTKSPTPMPSRSPTLPTKSPTEKPTKSPTLPTHSPTFKPSKSPTPKPTKKPTKAPTTKPTKSPTLPTPSPTVKPSKSPTQKPTKKPTKSPTTKPTMSPSLPTSSPTVKPTTSPTLPTPSPTKKPNKKQQKKKNKKKKTG